MDLCQCSSNAFVEGMFWLSICPLSAQRALRAGDRVDVNFFESREFAPFQDVLDGELKRLSTTGKYVQKKKLR